jgi:hypothetical protein
MVGGKMIQLHTHYFQAQRIRIISETLARLATPRQRERYQKLAAQNLEKWQDAAPKLGSGLQVDVFPEDWGVVARRLTQKSGRCYAVLNMANAYVPGGGYLQGAAAQEENMFRRTDCYFSLNDRQVAPRSSYYLPAFSKILNAEEHEVFLDLEHPRVCFRGPENRDANDLGYALLPDEEIFPFYELRAAAQNCSRGRPFDPVEAERRIEVQLNTLIAHGVRHAVLSAFGCGAFHNPAPVIASIYKRAIQDRAASFSHIAFAIMHAGYGPNNYSPFADVFSA